MRRKKKKSAAMKRHEARIRKELSAMETFRLQSSSHMSSNCTTPYSVKDSQMCDEDDIRNVVFGLKAQDVVMAKNSPARIPVYITLRHDKGAEHWDEIICPRFPNLRNSLQDSKFFPDAGERAEYGLFAKTLNEVLAGDIVTTMAMYNLGNAEFAEWLCSGGMSAFRYRNRYSFVIKVINVFPYTVDTHGCIHLVGRCFNQEFLKSLKGDIPKQFANFAESFDGKNESAADNANGLEKSLAALDLPIYPAVFAKTDLEDTLGDEFFRYITFTPGLGLDSTVEIAVKSAIEINEVLVMMDKNVILHRNGRVRVADRGTVLITGWQTPIIVATFQEIVSSAGKTISIKIVDSTGRCHEYTSGEELFSIRISALQKVGNFQYEALFVDMGSTFSKMLAVGVDGESGKYDVDTLGNDNKIYRTTAQFLKDYGLLPLMLEAMNDVSNATTELSKLAVSFKEKMEESPDRYARFLADAIKVLARHYLGKYNMILDSVRWSFPKTCKGDFFNRVQDNVRSMIVGYTRQSGESSFRLYPEHEALRLMFDSAIKSLAEQAHHAQDEAAAKMATIERSREVANAAITQKWENYVNNTRENWTRWGWFSPNNWGRGLRNAGRKQYANNEASRERDKNNENAAMAKAHTLRDLTSKSWYDSACILQALFEKHHATWSGLSILNRVHRMIRNLQEHKPHASQMKNDGALPSYGYLDAGGYSLDSVVVTNGADIPELTRSFKAGGEQLLMKVCALNNMDFANENDRKQVLASINKGTYDGDSKYRQIVADVYGDYVKQFERFVFCGGDRGSRTELWYLVFSGGVSINSTFLRLFNPILRRDMVGIDISDERISDSLKEAEFDAPKISSVFLYGFAEGISRDTTVHNLEIFRRIVRDRDHGRPCETYDIVGGMLQDALKNR